MLCNYLWHIIFGLWLLVHSFLSRPKRLGPSPWSSPWQGSGRMNHGILPHEVWVSHGFHFLTWHRGKMVWQHLWLGVRLLPSVTSRKCTPLKGNRKREQKSSNRTKLTKLAQQKERLFDPKPLEFQIHLWQLQLRTYEPLPAPQFYPVPSNPSTFVEISLPCFISAQGSTWGLKQWSDAALIW